MCVEAQGWLHAGGPEGYQVLEDAVIEACVARSPRLFNPKGPRLVLAGEQCNSEPESGLMLRAYHRVDSAKERGRRQ